MDGIEDIGSNDKEEPPTPQEPTYHQQQTLYQAQRALFANTQIISLELEQSMRHQGYRNCVDGLLPMFQQPSMPMGLSGSALLPADAPPMLAAGRSIQAMPRGTISKKKGQICQAQQQRRAQKERYCPRTATVLHGLLQWRR